MRRFFQRNPRTNDRHALGATAPPSGLPRGGKTLANTPQLWSTDEYRPHGPDRKMTRTMVPSGAAALAGDAEKFASSRAPVAGP